MKEIQVKGGHVTQVDNDIYERLGAWRWWTVRSGKLLYVRGWNRETCKRVLMHRLILGIENSPKDFGDHKDGNTFNNLRSNLRVASKQQNAHNRKSRTDTSSHHKGVSFDKSKRNWRAQIYVGGKTIYIGIFVEERLAAEAYNQAAIKYFGEYARPNKID